ncbi:MAG: hypothetical protein JKY28_04560 [Sulfurimonas sp.]|nr:hypothetical protein [Sulfurimonas sp.]
MQRKNNFLAHTKGSHRNGIAMIGALFIIVIMSTIMALSLSLSTQTSKRTTDLYLYEQSILLSQSAAEYAMLRLSQVPACSIDNINFIYNTIYTINIDMLYITLGVGTCFNGANNDGTDYGITTTPQSNGSVLMDITVSVNDPTITSEPIRYFRRSIQKL